MRFLYLRDTLFLFCLATYFVNRFVLKAIWRDGFVHEHLNDVICVPFWVPIVLWAQMRLGLREGDGPPRPTEVIIPLIVWAWTFEILLPQAANLGDLFVADHLDILSYASGALFAGLFWKWRYSESGQRPACPG
jgi:hypothetical protein